MYQTEETVEVTCSPEAAFKHIASEFFTNHSRWDPAVVRMTKSTPGPVGAGTLGQEHRRFAGRELVSNVEVTEFDPTRRFAFRSTSGPVREHVIWEIAPGTQGSRVHIALRFTAAGLPMRLMSPIMRRVLARSVSRNIPHMCDALDSAE